MTQGGEEVKYLNLPGDQFPEEYLEACSALFSSQYGTWSQSAPNPGGRIRLSGSRISDFLAPEGTFGTLAWVQGNLVGYALEARVYVAPKQSATWVTQLVVDEAHRQLGIAETMLRKVWGDVDQFAWGLVTSNPYAVRALERATQRRCDPALIRQHAIALHAAGSSSIPYIRDAVLAVSDVKTAIDTHFYSDHSLVTGQISATTHDAPWVLGDLAEGEEWLAFTFNSQTEQLPWAVSGTPTADLP